MVTFPVRYLINIPVVYTRHLDRDPLQDRSENALKNAILAFVRATRGAGDPTYHDDHISVRPRLPHSVAQPGTTQDEDDNDDAADAGTAAGV